MRCLVEIFKLYLTIENLKYSNKLNFYMCFLWLHKYKGRTKRNWFRFIICVLRKLFDPLAQEVPGGLIMYNQNIQNL